MLIDIIGDIPIEDVDREKARHFLENYQKLPKNRNKLRRSDNPYFLIWAAKNISDLCGIVDTTVFQC